MQNQSVILHSAGNKAEGTRQIILSFILIAAGVYFLIKFSDIPDSIFIGSAQREAKSFNGMMAAIFGIGGLAGIFIGLIRTSALSKNAVTVFKTGVNGTAGTALLLSTLDFEIPFEDIERVQKKGNKLVIKGKYQKYECVVQQPGEVASAILKAQNEYRKIPINGTT